MFPGRMKLDSAIVTGSTGMHSGGAHWTCSSVKAQARPPYATGSSTLLRASRARWRKAICAPSAHGHGQRCSAAQHYMDILSGPSTRHEHRAGSKVTVKSDWTGLTCSGSCCQAMCRKTPSRRSKRSMATTAARPARRRAAQAVGGFSPVPVQMWHG
jgi:hypothetical protein